MSTSPTQTSPAEATRAEAPTARRKRWPLAALASAAAVAAIAVTAAVVTGGSSDDDPVMASYALQASDPMAMCLAIDEAPPPPSGASAFAGTVTDVTAENVTVEVDHTYAGEPADVVTLTTGADVTAVALDGVEFVAGERYLVTAVDGLVQICGASGPATPELEAVYARWFPG
ncbi:MAG: hypothetical protein ACRDZZ_10755 [Ilumatobacteraceae bacterium]